ncbi:MAG: SufD family Fe-S cluster assembly protein, partial [Nanoarchaeota archaeon]
MKDINKGDKVYVWDKKTNKIKKAIVKNKIFSGYKKVYKLIAGERIIEASANHPFLVLDKNKTFWVPLEKINKGAHIAVINSNSKNFIDWNILDGIKFTKVTSIIPLGIKPTFDIEVENFHNFIANGLIVHNSKTTMLYPCSVLIGEGAKSDSLGIAFAGPGQNQDTGSKVIHAAPNTTSTIKAKSISKGGGISSYRGSVQVTKNAKNIKCSVVCDALLI